MFAAKTSQKLLIVKESISYELLLLSLPMVETLCCCDVGADLDEEKGKHPGCREDKGRFVAVAVAVATQVRILIKKSKNIQAVEKTRDSLLFESK